MFLIFIIEQSFNWKNFYCPFGVRATVATSTSFAEQEYYFTAKFHANITVYKISFTDNKISHLLLLKPH